MGPACERAHAGERAPPFGTISALFGLTNKIVSQAQYTILVTVVISSAVAPTLIAQAWFRPDRVPEQVLSPESGAAPDRGLDAHRPLPDTGGE